MQATLTRALFHFTQVLYKSNGDLKRVKLTSSGRRSLAVNERDLLVDHFDHVDYGNTRRRLFACEDCVEAWDAVCDEGAPSVCELVSYGSPITDAAASSIATVCDVFGSACSSAGGTEACTGQCVEDDDIVTGDQIWLFG